MYHEAAPVFQSQSASPKQAPCPNLLPHSTAAFKSDSLLLSGWCPNNIEGHCYGLRCSTSSHSSNCKGSPAQFLPGPCSLQTESSNYFSSKSLIGLNEAVGNKTFPKAYHLAIFGRLFARTMIKVQLLSNFTCMSHFVDILEFAKKTCSDLF